MRTIFTQYTNKQQLRQHISASASLPTDIKEEAVFPLFV